jgi:uncharacterized small protein (DUF1192 family)
MNREGAMIDDDNARGRVETAHVIGSDLSAISVGELRERIAQMEAEIARLEAEIARKEASRQDAASFFRL